MQAALFMSRRSAEAAAAQALRRRQADHFDVVPCYCRNGDRSVDFGFRVRCRKHSDVFYLQTLEP